MKTVGRYEILREVGRGGMAMVYLARQADLDRFVALKELGAFHASDPSVAHRFLRESRIAGSLSHPNIVTVYDYFEHEGTPYIAMEYVERGSLRAHIGRLTLAQIGGVFEGLLAGLMHAESLGIVHRDLKPENLMVTSDGRVKIADFGIAKATTNMQTGAFLTATGTTVGTPTYMAPEQAMAQEIGPWTDLYSVGCMAFELFTGLPPFHDSDAPMAILLRHVNEPIPPVKSIVPEVDLRISDWVDKLVVKDPRARPQTAREAWDDFEELLLALRGPRWRREARLGEVAGTPSAAESSFVSAVLSRDVEPADALPHALDEDDDEYIDYATLPPILPPTEPVPPPASEPAPPTPELPSPAPESPSGATILPRVSYSTWSNASLMSLETAFTGALRSVPKRSPPVAPSTIVVEPGPHLHHRLARTLQNWLLRNALAAPERDLVEPALERAMESADPVFAARATATLGRFLGRKPERRDDAAALLELAIELGSLPDSESGRHRLRLARLHYKARAYEHAMAALNDARACDDPSIAVRATVQLGRMCYQLHDSKTARMLYEAAILEDHADQSPKAAFYLGEVCLRDGRETEGVEALRFAMASNHPDAMPRAAVMLGRHHESRLRYREAADAYAHAIVSGHVTFAPEAKQRREARFASGRVRWKAAPGVAL